MTGRYSATYTPWAPLAADEKILAGVLTKADYATMMVCDCPHIMENGYFYDRGFEGFEWIRGQESDRWRTQPEIPKHPCDPSKIRGRNWLGKRHRRNVADWRFESDRFVARTMSAACDWLETNYKHKRFFLYVDTFDPHEPWDAPQWYVDMYDPGYKGEVVDYPRYAYTDFLTPEELRHCRALYAAEVTLVDRWVGRLLHKISDLGLMDSTVVILTTDHGFLHGEHGIIGKALIDDVNPGGGMTYIPLYEEINHIPLIISRPGGPKGRTSAMVQPADFMPTILDVAGVEPPDSVQGKSFAPVLADPAREARKFAVSLPFLGAGRVPVTVVRDRWSAVLYPSQAPSAGGTDKAVDGRDKTGAQAERAEDLLFDLQASPAQDKSVAKDHPERMSELRELLVEFLYETGTADEHRKRWERPPAEGK